MQVTNTILNLESKKGQVLFHKNDVAYTHHVTTQHSCIHGVFQQASQYREQVCQYSPQHLVASVAEEAVCVQRVLLPVQTQTHPVPLVLQLFLRHKRDLGGSPTEIQRSHRGSARAQPAAHKTILQVPKRVKQSS